MHFFFWSADEPLDLSKLPAFLVEVLATVLLILNIFHGTWKLMTSTLYFIVNLNCYFNEM